MLIASSYLLHAEIPHVWYRLSHEVRNEIITRLCSVCIGCKRLDVLIVKGKCLIGSASSAWEGLCSKDGWVWIGKVARKDDWVWVGEVVRVFLAEVYLVSVTWALTTLWRHLPRICLDDELSPLVLELLL